MKKFLSLLMLLPGAALASTFDGFYVGPTFSAATDAHTIGGQDVYNTKKHDHKKIDAVIGYGVTFDVPLYLGVEAYIPLRNETTSKKIDTVIGGVRAQNTHEITKDFPAEGVFKVGFPIDEKVMVYGKFGFVHQRFVHKVKDLNHYVAWSSSSPLYGAGLSFQVNGKWLLNGEFITYHTPKHNNLIFSHEHKHQRIQVTVAYRF